ncbi:MAG: NUMOD3 motif (2 copies) [archaeon ADurb.Bin336]|nr:MAG: NUMOD3 motif (2 copies) [archaeon ADurb.Bin336]
MNYEQVYKNLITSRQKLNRVKTKEIYYESHHIIPKCFGGDNSATNLVLLTPKEHFFAHLLLAHFHIDEQKKKMVFALWMLCNKNSAKCSSRQYQQAKESFIKANKNKIVSIETKEKISKALTGIKRPFKKKKPHSSETKKKISEANLGRIVSEEGRKNISEAHKGQVAWNRGMTLSDEKKTKLNSDEAVEKRNKTRIENLKNKNYKNLKLAKPIIQLSLEGEFIQEFESIAQAKLILVKSRGLIDCLKGRKDSYNGYKFYYK